MLQQKKGRLRYVSSEEVFGDKILSNALGSKEAIQNSINMVVKGGILLQIRRENASDAFMLNSESDREIASDIGSVYYTQLRKKKKREGGVWGRGGE